MAGTTLPHPGGRKNMSLQDFFKSLDQKRLDEEIKNLAIERVIEYFMSRIIVAPTYGMHIHIKKERPLTIISFDPVAINEIPLLCHTYVQQSPQICSCGKHFWIVIEHEKYRIKQAILSGKYY